jgi:ribonuclease HIII
MNDRLAAPPPKTSFSIPLDAAAQNRLEQELRTGNYRPLAVPHTRIAAERPGCRILLYTRGTCVAQGKGAEDWVRFVLEPEVLRSLVADGMAERNPEAFTPHMGIDESGKGDFFGPMVIAAVYTDRALAEDLLAMGVRDSKAIGSDARARRLAESIRRRLGGRFAIVPIGPAAYNRLHADMRTVNRILAWGHARAIENLLERVPDCPRAVADQFGPERQIRAALLHNGRRIDLVQRPRAESDPAVGAASILARDGFLAGLERLSERFGVPLPKGASAAVQDAGEALIARHGPAALLDAAKCHFRTTDAVLARVGSTRDALGPLGRASPPPARRPRPATKGAPP